MVHMRVDYPEEPEVIHIPDCHISYRESYIIPKVHDFPCQYAKTTPGRDPNYSSPGLHIYVHSAIGFFPERKVRIAWCI